MYTRWPQKVLIHEPNLSSAFFADRDAFFSGICTIEQLQKQVLELDRYIYKTVLEAYDQDLEWQRQPSFFTFKFHSNKKELQNNLALLTKKRRHLLVGDFLLAALVLGYGFVGMYFDQVFCFPDSRPFLTSATPILVAVYNSRQYLWRVFESKKEVEKALPSLAQRCFSCSAESASPLLASAPLLPLSFSATECSFSGRRSSRAKRKRTYDDLYVVGDELEEAVEEGLADRSLFGTEQVAQEEETQSEDYTIELLLENPRQVITVKARRGPEIRGGDDYSTGGQVAKVLRIRGMGRTQSEAKKEDWIVKFVGNEAEAKLHRELWSNKKTKPYITPLVEPQRFIEYGRIVDGKKRQKRKRGTQSEAAETAVWKPVKVTKYIETPQKRVRIPRKKLEEKKGLATKIVQEALQKLARKKAFALDLADFDWQTQNNTIITTDNIYFHDFGCTTLPKDLNCL